MGKRREEPPRLAEEKGKAWRSRTLLETSHAFGEAEKRMGAPVPREARTAQSKPTKCLPATVYTLKGFDSKSGRTLVRKRLNLRVHRRVVAVAAAAAVAVRLHVTMLPVEFKGGDSVRMSRRSIRQISLADSSSKRLRGT